MPQNGFLTEQGLAIRQARLARGMTQSVLAEAAGVSEKTIRRGEGGERLQAESVLAICSVLGLDPANLRSEAEMDPKADFERRNRRIRAGVLTGATATALLAATVAAVVIARSGGGYREAADLTIGSAWFNVWMLGFGYLNVLPMLPGTRRLPGMAALNRRLAPFEPYGLAITAMLFAFAVATLLPFALTDGWAAIRDGGQPGKVLTFAISAVGAPIAVVLLASVVAGSDGWNKWAERRLARADKAANTA